LTWRWSCVATSALPDHHSLGRAPFSSCRSLSLSWASCRHGYRSRFARTQSWPSYASFLASCVTSSAVDSSRSCLRRVSPLPSVRCAAADCWLRSAGQGLSASMGKQRQLSCSPTSLATAAVTQSAYRLSRHLDCEVAAFPGR